MRRTPPALTKWARAKGTRAVVIVSRVRNARYNYPHMVEMFRLLGYAYLTALAVAAILGVYRRSLLWPMFAAWFGSAALVTFGTPWEAAARGAWLTDVWMPSECTALLVTAICLTVMIARETCHPDPIRRFTLRFSLFAIPVAVAAIIYTLDPHDTIFWTFVAIRSRFWQGMLLAWVILWLNTWDGKRLGSRGVLCLHVSFLNGIAGSFGPSTVVQVCFLGGMIGALVVWAMRPEGGLIAQRSSALLPSRGFAHGDFPERGASAN